jgi:hypothetical protein
MKKCLPVLLVLIAIASCNQKPKDEQQSKNTKQDLAVSAIEKWMQGNTDYEGYKPIEFGEINPRFERTARSMQLESLIYEEIALNPNGSEKLDSLKNIQQNNMGNLMGYIILHKYETSNIAGEKFANESLFFLDTVFRVATVLNPEAFDQILIERHVFRLDSVE